MLRLAILIALIGLAACASKPPPVAHGPWHQLNVGMWNYNTNALTDPPPGFRR